MRFWNLDLVFWIEESYGLREDSRGDKGHVVENYNLFECGMGREELRVARYGMRVVGVGCGLWVGQDSMKNVNLGTPGGRC